MKVLQIYSVVTAVLAIGGRVPMYADEPVAEGYPSKGFFQKSGRAQDARFVLHEERDLRLLFCDRRTLKDRMNRSVCVEELRGQSIVLTTVRICTLLAYHWIPR